MEPMKITITKTEWCPSWEDEGHLIEVEEVEEIVFDEYYTKTEAHRDEIALMTEERDEDPEEED